MLRLIQKETVPHAFLFSGMPGTGKLAAAREFAKALDCFEPRDSDCCGRCASCRKMEEGVHPDLILVRSEAAFIKLDQVRELRERFRFRPFEGKWRIVIIEDAQKLREEAANAILKILEEPPAGNAFILLAPEPQMLLPTIVSRCCHVRFQPLAEEVVAEAMERESGLGPERAAEVARLSAGSLSRARWLAEADRIGGWKKVLENIEKLKELAILDFFPMISEWVKNRESTEQDLECIRLWVRDLVLFRLACGHPRTFDLDGGTKEALRDIPAERLFLLYRNIEQALRNLKVNANPQLTLEGVCLAIKDSLYGKGDWNPFSKGRQDLPF